MPKMWVLLCLGDTGSVPFCVHGQQGEPKTVSSLWYPIKESLRCGIDAGHLRTLSTRALQVYLWGVCMPRGYCACSTALHIAIDFQSSAFLLPVHTYRDVTRGVNRKNVQCTCRCICGICHLMIHVKRSFSKFKGIEIYPAFYPDVKQTKNITIKYLAMYLKRCAPALVQLCRVKKVGLP